MWPKSMQDAELICFFGKSTIAWLWLGSCLDYFWFLPHPTLPPPPQKCKNKTPRPRLSDWRNGMKEFCLFLAWHLPATFSWYLWWVSGETALLKGELLKGVIKPLSAGVDMFTSVLIHFGQWRFYSVTKHKHLSDDLFLCSLNRLVKQLNLLTSCDCVSV